MARKPQDSSFTYSEFNPLTPNQIRAVQEFRSGKNLLLHGCAGTGKTMLALSLGLKQVAAKKFDSLVIVRSIVPTRDVGFLPGTLEEKVSYYEQPYKALVNEIVNRGDAYDTLKKKEVIRFVSTTHVRGTTIKDSLVLFDEVQNTTFHEAESVITRLGTNTRLILAGDTNQSDLRGDKDRDGIFRLLKVISKMQSFGIIEFDKNDIVRSGLVKEFLIAKADLGF